MVLLQLFSLFHTFGAVEGERERERNAGVENNDKLP